MNDDDLKNRPAPPKEVNMSNIIKPNMPQSFTTSAEIRLDQSMKMFLQGKRHYDSGDFEKAINLLESAIQCLKPGELSNQETSVFYSYLGLAMQKKGWHAYAKAKFQTALSLNPNDSIALENLKSIGVSPNIVEPAKKVVATDKKVTPDAAPVDRSFIKKIRSIFSK